MLESRDLSEYKSSAKKAKLIDSCSDKICAAIAGKIAMNKAAGMPTADLEKKLEEKTIDMLNSTRALIH